MIVKQAEKKKKAEKNKGTNKFQQWVEKLGTKYEIR